MNIIGVLLKVNSWCDGFTIFTTFSSLNYSLNILKHFNFQTSTSIFALSKTSVEQQDDQLDFTGKILAKILTRRLKNKINSPVL